MCLAPQRRAIFQQFFDICTSKSGPRVSVFLHFDFKMCFSLQRRAIFPHHNGEKKLTSLKHAYAPSMKLQPKPRSFERKRATKQISPKTLRVSYQTVPNSNKFRVSILVWVEPQSHPDTRSGILQNPLVHIIIYQFYRYGYI